MIFNCSYLIEILTPKRSNSDSAKDKMNLFAERYYRIIDSGSGISIPDNPMGQPRYTLVETIARGGLPVHADRIVMNLNTFHTRGELDSLLRTASCVGLKYLLIIRGDGGPALPKLEPESIGVSSNIVTSIDLLRYINSEFSGVFITGAAFNQYNRVAFETNRLKKKLDAGAKFIITQPVIGKDPNVDQLKGFDIPVVIEAWMSKNVDLLFKSARKEKDERAEGYNPVQNLRTLHSAYPENCIYLSMLSFKQEWKTLLPRL